MARSVEDAVKDAQGIIDLKELKRAIEEKDRATLQRIVDDVIREFNKAMNTSMPVALLDTLEDGGIAAGATAKAEGTLKTAEFTLVFDRVNPQSVKWANESSAALVKGVSAETRRGIQEIIARAFEEGIPPAAAARLIRESVGLTERGARALGNAEARLRKAKPGTLVKLGRKKYRIPAGGLSSSQIETFTSRYGTKLLNDRAKMIARTETIASANEGQRQLWLQAEQQGLLIGTELREWIITPDSRLCEICQAMEGQLTGIKDTFFSPVTGNRVIGPPVHPDCRCAVGLTDKTEKEQAEIIRKQEKIIPFESELGLKPKLIEETPASRPWPIDDNDTRRFDKSVLENFKPIKLKKNELDAIRGFNDSIEYGSLQNALWAEKKLSKGAKILKNNLEAIIAKGGSAGKDLVTWRGLSGDPTELLKKYKVGSKVTFKGFTSTSVDPFAASGFSRGFLFEIKPKSGMYIGDLVTKHKGEKEFLMGLNKKFRVEKILKNVQLKGSDEVYTVVQLVEL